MIPLLRYLRIRMTSVLSNAPDPKYEINDKVFTKKMGQGIVSCYNLRIDVNHLNEYVYIWEYGIKFNNFIFYYPEEDIYIEDEK